MAAPTTYGVGFRHANTFMKAHGVYFHMHQTSTPYHVEADRNHYFSAEIFFYQWCARRHMVCEERGEMSCYKCEMSLNCRGIFFQIFLAVTAKRLVFEFKPSNLSLNKARG
jgi:hypothetical protein